MLFPACSVAVLCWFEWNVWVIGMARQCWWWVANNSFVWDVGKLSAMRYPSSCQSFSYVINICHSCGMRVFVFKCWSCSTAERLAWNMCAHVNIRSTNLRWPKEPEEHKLMFWTRVVISSSPPVDFELACVHSANHNESYFVESWGMFALTWNRPLWRKTEFIARDDVGGSERERKMGRGGILSDSPFRLLFLWHYPRPVSPRTIWVMAKESCLSCA